MDTHTLNDVSTWRGCTVLDKDDDKIGSLEDVYLDRQSGAPEWAAIRTGLFGMRTSFAPIDGATPGDGELRIPYAKDLVKDAPNVDADGELSPQEEQALYTHYGREWGQWDDATPDATEGILGKEERFNRDEAMTRSEEELSVGTERREAGRARLRKYVVTEQVQKTVPVQREEVRIEREPITEGNLDEALDGPEISEAEHEVTLHEEVPVVEKTTVPKERVRLEKDTHVEQETVTDEVRKERIEADGEQGRL